MKNRAYNTSALGKDEYTDEFRKKRALFVGKRDKNPEWLQELVFHICCDTSIEKKTVWIERFYASVPAGFNLQRIRASMMYWLSTEVSKSIDRRKFVNINKLLCYLTRNFSSTPSSAEKNFTSIKNQCPKERKLLWSRELFSEEYATGEKLIDVIESVASTMLSLQNPAEPLDIWGEDKGFEFWDKASDVLETSVRGNPWVRL